MSGSMFPWLESVVVLALGCRLGSLLFIVFEIERKAIRFDEEAKENMSHCLHLHVGACMAMHGSYPPPQWLEELPHSSHLIVCGGEGLTQPPFQIGLPLGGLPTGESL